MTLLRYSIEEIRNELRKKAEEICKKLSPVAVEVTVIDALNNVKVFVKCIEVK